MCVQWGHCISSTFTVSNGVKQGGILSPKLFIVYMDDLSNILNKTNIGGKVGGMRFNHLCYADDLCLVSISSAGMQKLFNICEKYGVDHDLIYNSAKTMCMCFSPKFIKLKSPTLMLDGEVLNFVEKNKYLGVIIQTNSTEQDVIRQMRKFYANANMLIRKFSNCSYEVKCQFWFNNNKRVMDKLRVSYNNSLRRLLKIPTRNSASQMFVSLNIMSFGELLRKSIYDFMQRLQKCDFNGIIIGFTNTEVMFQSSGLRTWWSRILKNRS